MILRYFLAPTAHEYGLPATLLPWFGPCFHWLWHVDGPPHVRPCLSIALELNSLALPLLCRRSSSVCLYCLRTPILKRD